MSKLILIIGSANSGKTTLARLLANKLGEGYDDSSRVAFNKFLWDRFRGEYPNKQACYSDRVNNREVWGHLIHIALKDNYTAIADDAIRRGVNILTGVRDKVELESIIKKYSPYIIGVERDGIEEDRSLNYDIEDYANEIFKNTTINNLINYVNFFEDKR